MATGMSSFRGRTNSYAKAAMGNAHMHVYMCMYSCSHAAHTRCAGSCADGCMHVCTVRLSRTLRYIVSFGDALYRAVDAVEKLKNEGKSVGVVNKVLRRSIAPFPSIPLPLLSSYTCTHAHT